AFGVVLYELLAGERLFKGSDATETMLRVLNDAPSLERVPSKVHRLLEECLKKDPEQRLRWIGDAGRMLESAPVPTRDRQGAAWWKIAAAVLLALAAAVSVLYFRATRPPEQPLTRFSVDLGRDAEAGQRTTAAISPDGRRLVFVARGGGGNEQLATRL